MLLAAIRDQEGAHLFVGMPADPHAAVGAGTLRVDLFYWLSAQPGWPLDREVEAIEAALGRLQSS